MNDSYEFYERFRNERVTVNELTEVKDGVSKECRAYLTGKLCFDEIGESAGRSRSETYERLRLDFRSTKDNFRRLMVYKLAVDRLRELVPEYMPSIINGEARLSVENTITASKWDADKIRAALEKLRDPAVKIKTVFSERPSHISGVRKHRRTVKDVPAFDPEAQLTGICYTIPSWVAAIDRAFMSTEFGDVSMKTKYVFIKELTVLKDTALLVLELLKERGK